MEGRQGIPTDEDRRNGVEIPEEIEIPLESPVESGGEDEVAVMKPAQLELIDIPSDFTNFGMEVGKGFQVNGVVWHVYHALKPKHGKPRLMITPIKLIGIKGEVSSHE